MVVDARPFEVAENPLSWPLCGDGLVGRAPVFIVIVAILLKE